jgi:hypothetical protein
MIHSNDGINFNSDLRRGGGRRFYRVCGRTSGSQGETLEEVRENLSEAIELILTSNREQFEKNFSSNGKITRETLILRAA